VVVPLSVDEVARFWSSFRTSRDLAIVGLMLLHGLRSCEVLALNVEDIQFPDSQIRVLGKGKRIRVLPLTRESVELLEHYLSLERPPLCGQALFVCLKGPARGSRMLSAGLRSSFQVKNGLITFYLLVVMELASRRVHFAGTTVSPEDQWMKQIARNLSVADEGFLVGKRYLLMDRDTKFSEGFRDILRDSGVKAVRLPPRSPNLNAHLERFWRSLREECLHRMIFFGEDMLRRAVRAYLSHYHGERNHQGLDNRLIEAGEEVGRQVGEVQCREHLGGILRYYYRQAA
jgi:hypothetical protein